MLTWGGWGGQEGRGGGRGRGGRPPQQVVRQVRPPSSPPSVSSASRSTTAACRPAGARADSRLPLPATPARTGRGSSRSSQPASRPPAPAQLPTASSPSRPLEPALVDPTDQPTDRSLGAPRRPWTDRPPPRPADRARRPSLYSPPHAALLPSHTTPARRLTPPRIHTHPAGGRPATHGSRPFTCSHSPFLMTLHDNPTRSLAATTMAAARAPVELGLSAPGVDDSPPPPPPPPSLAQDARGALDVDQQRTTPLPPSPCPA